MPGIALGARAAKTNKQQLLLWCSVLEEIQTWKPSTIWLDTKSDGSTYKVGGGRESWKSKPGLEPPRDA